VDHFVSSLVKEVVRRMEALHVKGKHITVKVMKRKESAGEPHKFLGHGICYALSRSGELRCQNATREHSILYTTSMKLLSDLDVSKEDIRGMGIVVSKLMEDNKKTTMATWLQHPSNRPAQDSTIIKEHKAKEISSVAEVLEPSLAATAAGKSEEQVMTPKKAEPLLQSQCDNSPPIVINDDDTNHDDCFDVELPPLSQIDETQISEMPPALRDRIRKKIEDHKLQDTKCPAEERFTPASRRNILQPQHTKRRKAKKRLFAPDGDRQVQVSVKRMLKLANLKSERATELDALPLALQLHVMQQDAASFDGSMMRTPPKKDSTRGRDYTSASRSTSQYHLLDQEAIQVLEAGAHALAQPLVGVSTGNTVLSDNECVAVLPLQEKSDALVLAHFMDNNESPTSDDVETMIRFICVCIDELRAEDAFNFLRMIKHRCDEWGTLCYDQIRESAVMYFSDKDGGGRKVNYTLLNL
jgi:hypothetical protein